MEREFNEVKERDSDKEHSEEEKNSFKKLMRQKAEKYLRKSFKHLSPRHQHMIEDFINLQLGHSELRTYRKRDVIFINEIYNGRVSFAFKGLEKIPRCIIEILRHDITHLDLTANRIRNFEFLRVFKTLKSLIIDSNCRIDMESIPPIDTLELFYANKCNIEFPRSFIFRVSVVFKSLKYLSMMNNPVKKQFVTTHIWKGREHRMRMFAIFMMPKLIHFDDKATTEAEREHSQKFHMYLGPVDCQLTKFKSLPDTDAIRNILPVHIRDKNADVVEMESQDDEYGLEEALASISISKYFKDYQIQRNDMKYTGKEEKKPASSNVSDEGLGSSMENFYH